MSKNYIPEYLDMINRSNNSKKLPPTLLIESYDSTINKLQSDLVALKLQLDSKTSRDSWGGAGGGASTSLDLYRPTKVVNSNYAATSRDYYIGVNAAEAVVITLPGAKNGREIIIKDESGYASVVPITIVGNIDGETSVLLKINYGAMTFLYRDGWRII